MQTREYYKYVGDNIGTDLEKDTKYMIAAIGIDDIVLHKAWGIEAVEITKEEFKAHREMGTLEKAEK